MPKIWLRLGADLELTQEEAAELKDSPDQEILERLIKKNGVTVNGSTYCPLGCGLWDSEEHEWDLDPLKLRNES